MWDAIFVYKVMEVGEIIYLITTVIEFSLGVLANEQELSHG